MSAVSFRKLFEQAAAQSRDAGGLARRSRALRMGNDLSTVQELMGHDSPETTLIYVGADGAKGASPLDVGAAELQPRRAVPLALGR